MAKYDPLITVTSVKGIDDQSQKLIGIKPDVLEDNVWEHAYESELGIKVKYTWTAPGNQFVQKLNTQIAANSLPDIIPCSATQLKMLVDNDVAADLTDVFRRYATDFTNEMMKEDNNIGVSQATIGGRLKALPHLDGNRDAANMWWVRKDWLGNLGLGEPKTMDDILKIAEAFAKDDPDQDGKADTYGLALHKDLFSGTAGLEAFMEGYHAYCDGWLKDSSGKIVSGVIQPEVKAALSTLQKLYAKGIVDKEFAVKDASKVSEDIIAGKTGLFSGQHWQAFYPIPDSVKKNPKASWAVYPIVSSDGKPAKTMLNGSTTTFYAVNKSMKNPEAAVKLYNYFYKKDPAISKDFDSAFHGINGEQETKVGNNYCWAVELSFYPKQNLFISQQVNKYLTTKDESLLKNFWVKDNVTQIQKYLAGDKTLYGAWMWCGPDSAEQVIDKYDKNSLFLQNAYIGADTDSMTQYNTTLDHLKLTEFTKIIMGQSPIGAFDDFVSQWHKLGGDSITEEVNEAK